jgi:hypothetical protein
VATANDELERKAGMGREKQDDTNSQFLEEGRRGEMGERELIVSQAVAVRRRR